MGLLKREADESAKTEPAIERCDRSPAGRIDHWLATVRLRRPGLSARWLREEVIRVDEFQENGTLVVRAALPGIDPDKDVVLTVTDGMLHIEAERSEEEETAERGYLRRELRCGTFSRTLPLLPGVAQDDVKASYRDGILEVRVPTADRPAANKVPITRS